MIVIINWNFKNAQNEANRNSPSRSKLGGEDVLARPHIPSDRDTIDELNRKIDENGKFEK
jgi:hypothetical protein